MSPFRYRGWRIDLSPLQLLVVAGAGSVLHMALVAVFTFFPLGSNPPRHPTIIVRLIPPPDGVNSVDSQVSFDSARSASPVQEHPKIDSDDPPPLFSDFPHRDPPGLPLPDGLAPAARFFPPHPMEPQDPSTVRFEPDVTTRPPVPTVKPHPPATTQRQPLQVNSRVQQQLRSEMSVTAAAVPVKVHIPKPTIEDALELQTLPSTQAVALRKQQRVASQALPMKDVLPAPVIPPEAGTLAQLPGGKRRPPSTDQQPPSQVKTRSLQPTRSELKIAAVTEPATVKIPQPPTQVVELPMEVSTPASSPAVASQEQRGAETDALPMKELFPQPVYPPELAARGIGGLVKLRVRVGVDGVARSVSVSSRSGYAAFDRAAVDVMRRWRFAPAQRAGTSVEMVITVPIRFKMESR